MTNRRKFIATLLPAAVLPLVGWSEQKTPISGDSELGGERSAQRSLPRSGDPFWKTLSACKVKYNAKTDLYSLIPTPEVRAMAGQVVKVKGFIIPLDGLDLTKHFLIGVNTPVCLFHPPGEPNEVIEVKSPKALVWDDRPKTIEGTFSLINNPAMGVFFAMSGARPVKT